MPDTILADTMLNDDFKKRALDQGLVFRLEKTDEALMVSPRENYSSSIWVGVDKPIPANIPTTNDTLFIERYIKEVLKGEVKDYYHTVVYENTKAIQGLATYSLDVNTLTNDIDTYKKSYIIMSHHDLRVARDRFLSLIAYELAMYQDYKEGRIFDIFMQNKEGETLDSISHVYNTDGVAVADYSENMLDLYTDCRDTYK